MEMEPGKLFVGGISWDTNEDRLREYFQTFGEVVEAVIMKDRTTGRARGFGFIVFADPAVAESVVREKHIIDGRTVEAKKAVPRDDQNSLSRNSSSSQGSPSPIRTKKIFVGGLASTVTESDFKKYFDQFGIITDVVVMYDHQTQRPRGFGFITFDSEESVENVLHKTFHELNGKMVEVKRAVPKELSPGPTRAQFSGYNYGPSRVNSFLNAYTQGGYNPSLVGGYGVRVEGRYSPVNVGRSGYSLFSPSGYELGLNSEPGLSPSYPGSGYGHGLNSVLSRNPNRHGGISGGIGSLLGSTSRSLWANGSLNSANSSEFVGSGNGNSGLTNALGNIEGIWGSSPISGLGGGTDAGYSSFGSGDISFRSGGGGGYGRNRGSTVAPNDGGGDFGNFYGGGSLYADPTWQSSSLELEGSGSFDYGAGNATTDVINKNSAGYGGVYSVANRSNGGIAA